MELFGRYDFDLRAVRVALTASVSAIAAFASIVVQIIITPLILEAVGSERFGVWLTLVSAMNLLLIADLGVGLGLSRKIATETSHPNQGFTREPTTAFIILSVMSLCLLGVFAVSYGLGVETFFLGTESLSDREVIGAVGVAVLCVALSLPLSTYEQVQMGMQKGYLARLVALAATAVSLPLFWLLVSKETSVAQLILMQFGPLLFFRFLNTGVCFAHWPRFKLFGEFPSTHDIRVLLRASLPFFWLRLSAFLAYQSDILLIALLLGAGAVPEYAVPLRMFSIPIAILGLFMGPLMPAIAEADARGDIVWIQAALRRLFLCFFVGAACWTTFMFFMAEDVLRLWVGSAIVLSPSLKICFLAWSVFLIFGAITSTVLNGLGVFKFQLRLSWMMTIANLLLSVLLTVWLGILGPVLGSVLSYFVLIFLPITWLFARIWRRWDALSEWK